MTLGHWQAVLLAIPVRTWPCWNKYGGFDTVPDFLVTYHWMFFTHTVAVPWGGNNDELILRLPYDRPGQPDVVCVRG